MHRVASDGTSSQCLANKGRSRTAKETQQLYNVWRSGASNYAAQLNGGQVKNGCYWGGKPAGHLSVFRGQDASSQRAVLSFLAGVYGVPNVTHLDWFGLSIANKPHFGLTARKACVQEDSLWLQNFQLETRSIKRSATTPKERSSLYLLT
jgi:hypothetical protein